MWAGIAQFKYNKNVRMVRYRFREARTGARRPFKGQSL